MRSTPSALPVLSAGRHRSPRDGACLMEYTSLLAGERFSDHPRCTDPVLAALARAVNDVTSDAARSRLAVYAADLTTAHGAPAEVEYAIARRCLITALAYADGVRRRVLVVGLLGVDRAAAGVSRGWRPAYLDLESELALVGLANELAAAAETLRTLPVSPNQHRRKGLPLSVELAVVTIAEHAGEDADHVLARLLADCLALYRAALPATAASVPA